MLSSLGEDLNIVSKYLLKNIKQRKQKVLNLHKVHISKFGSENVLDKILMYNGVSELGGQLIGQQTINGYPVNYYSLKRENSDDQFFYIAYIDRSRGQYQVVVCEDWDTFSRSIKKIITTSQKVLIDLDTSKRGGSLVGKNGRRKL